MTISVDEAVECGLATGTMLDVEQLRWLHWLATNAPDGPAVEVGVWKGGSILCWRQARWERGGVYAVDNFYAHLSHRPGADKTRASFLRHIDGCDISFIEELGHQAASHFTDGSVAFCFIDADHGEGGITLDLPAWVPKIMPGGTLAFHDYDVWKPTVVVKREVDAWQNSLPTDQKWFRHPVVGSVAAFVRPDNYPTR